MTIFLLLGSGDLLENTQLPGSPAGPVEDSGVFIVLRKWHPVARDDGIAFTSARVEGRATQSDPWVEVETFTISADSTPATPGTYTFETADALAEQTFFRVVWSDVLGNFSESAEARQRSMPPSASEVRQMSEFVRLRFPADPFVQQVEDDLEGARAVAAQTLKSMTCRTLDDSLPAELIEIARRAFVFKVEQYLQAWTLKNRRSSFGQQRLRSISAGPWSETYFGPEEASKARMLDPDPMVNELLWALATDECKQKWMELWTGEFSPFAMVEAFDWRQTFPGRY